MNETFTYEGYIKFLIYLFGPVCFFLLAVLGLSAYNNIQPGMAWTDIAFFIFLVVSCLFLIGGGIYYVLYIASWKLTLTQTTIEIHYLRTQKVYYLRDIFYYEYDMGALHLVSVDPKDSFAISLFVKNFHRISFFCYQRFPICLNQEPNLRAITHSEIYGTHILERLRTLIHFTKKNRIIHVILVGISIVNFFTLGSLPFMLLTVSLIPLFVFWWVWYSKGMVQFSDEKSIQPHSFILLIAGIASFLFSCHFAFLVEKNWYFLLLGLIPAYLFYHYILTKPSVKQHLTKSAFIAVAAVLPLWGQAIVKSLNCTLGLEKKVPSPQIVETKYFSEVETNLFPTVVFEDNLNNLTGSIIVPYELYEHVQPQDTIYLPIHEGALGINWTSYVYLGSAVSEISLHSISGENTPVE